MSYPWPEDPPTQRNEVVIVGIDIPMMVLIRLMLKWSFATIVAAMIPVGIGYLIVNVTVLIFSILTK